MNETVEIQHVPDFHVYAAANRANLQTNYPFLSKDQINHKLKDSWNKLDDTHKRKYSKSCVKITPVKHNIKNKIQKKVKKGSKSKSTKSRAAIIKDDSMQVCDTPDFFNEKKLSDFRLKHDEKYENDFVLRMDDFSGKAQQADSGASYFQRTQHSSQTTEGVNNFPCKQPGILKRGSSSKKKQKERVSFTSMPEENEGAFNCIVDGDDGIDDEEDIGVLISRHDVEPKELLNEVGTADSDDDNDAAILITREDCFQHEVDLEVASAGQPQGSFLEGSGAGEMDIDTHNPKEEENKYDLGSLENGKASKNACETRRPTTNSTEKGTPKFTDQCDSQSSKNSQGSDVAFKSPNPKKSCSKSTRKQKSTPRFSAAESMPQKTPDIARHGTENDYTTPQMDELLQKLTMEEVNKAPQKRRMSKDAADDDKLKAVTSGKRVTRSLLNKTADSQDNNAEMCEFQGPKEKVSDKGRKRQRKSMRGKTGNEAVSMDPAGDACMDPAGDAGKNRQSSLERDFENPSSRREHDFTGDGAKTIKRKSAPGKGKKSPAPKKVKLVTEETSASPSICRKLRTRSFSSGSSQSSSSDSQGLRLSLHLDVTPGSSVSSLSSLRPLRRKSELVNPTLERALRSLRTTSVTSDSNHFISGSDTSSPCLLSPALSGISELSSASSQSSKDEGGDENNNVVQRPYLSKDRSLCDMFADVTPPEKKTKGQYKTNRMLTSGSAHRDTSLTQWFTENNDDLFGSPDS
ncbi:uncharacterized protein LOC128228214 isoform X2 [Mya arenaria]|uniref:uncharacterized protein LOC128228214 isoform X2 n=1 Tax=Mya arenaria TaxID=6604 RepID=UPI0022E52483|nr:uncharacterized protein LOC128228214 isoform X2 [Mya arenaria]